MDSVVNENYNDPEKSKLDEDSIAANAEGSEFDDSKVKFLNGGKGLEDSNVVVEVDSKDGESFTGLGKEELMQYASDPFWVRTRLILFILFWVGWVAMLAAAIVIIVLAPRCPYRPDQKWWNKESVYQVFPKSFRDAENNDGLGDLRGVLDVENSHYFDNLTSNVIWLNAIYESPLLDSGYDVTNHKNISNVFGNEELFKELLRSFHKKGKKVVLDFIPNHTSDKHPWFEKSRNKEGKYTNYYVWAPDNGQPPNNWQSVNNGSAWKLDDVRKEYYLHQYFDFEPDLNLTNPDVIEELDSILRYWLERGVDGFHVVGAAYLMESKNFTGNEKNDAAANLDILSQFRQIVDSFVKKPGSERLLFASVPGTDNVTNMYIASEDKTGLHFVVNQALVNRPEACDGKCIRDLVDTQMNVKNWTGWTLGNQDSHRFASRSGPKYVKAMHTLQMLLPGTAVIYYGDEIGLRDAPVTVNSTDPRDEYRTPMRWTGGPKAGFTSATPWLPIDTSNQPNVQEQKAIFAGFTDLEFFWELGKIRKDPSFQWGKMKYSVVDESVFSFLREAEGFPGYLVAMNFGDAPVVRTFVKPDGELPKMAEIVLHSKGKSGEEYTGTHKLRMQSLKLQPGDVVVYKLPVESE